MLLLPWIVNIIFFKKLKTIYQQTVLYGPFLLSILIVDIVIFSLFGQKSIWYILPIIPFMLIFITRLFVEYHTQIAVIRLNRYVLGFLFGAAFLFCFTMGISSTTQQIIFKSFGGNFNLSPWVMYATAAIALITMIYVFFSKRDLLCILAFSSIMLILLHSSMNTYLFKFEKQFTNLAAVSNILQNNTDGVALYKTDYLGQFAFTSRQTVVIPSIKKPTILMEWLQAHPNGIVIFSGNKCPKIASLENIAQYQERVNQNVLLLCRNRAAS